MSKVIDWIFQHQWAITKEALQTIVMIADRERSEIDLILKGEKEIDTKALVTKMGEPLDGSHRTTVRNGVAIIPVTGPIFPRANLFTRISGATSLESLASDFSLAVNDPAIKAIIFNLDSPGGEVTGTTEMSKMIFDARGKKPIISYVYGLGASAAYWIASASDLIVVSPTAQLGSIGVIAAIQDEKVKDEKAGVKTIQFVSSVSPFKSLDIDSESGRGRIQAIIDNLAGVMIADIARNRGTEEATVLEDFGKGGIFVGALAIGQGLADEIGSLEQTISKFTNTFIQKGGSMNLQEFQSSHPELFAEVKKMGKAEAEEAITAKITEAQEKSAEAENARIRTIEEIDSPEASELISKNKFDRKQTKESVSALIVSQQATQRKEAREQLERDGQSLADNLKGIGFQAPASPDAARSSIAKIAADAANTANKNRK